MGANRIKILRQCFLTNSFASGRCWTLTLPVAWGFPIIFCSMGANRIKILRQCSLTNSFATGRYWTPTGRLLDALLDALLDGEANPSLRYKPEKSSS